MKKIPLTQGKFAFIDDDDFERISAMKWCYAKNRNGGYAVTYISGSSSSGRRNMSMHRFVNKTPAGLKTDHRDGNGLNNQKHNLRNATNSQNLCNISSLPRSTSKYKGVSLDKKKFRWVAQIKKGQKSYFLGRYDDEIDAAKAYDLAAVKYHGVFAKINGV